MSAFLWFHLLLSAAVALWRMNRLAREDGYPRTETFTRAEEVCALLINLTLLFWAFWLLFVAEGGAS